MPTDDGYPTDKELTQIREWPLTDLLGWFAFIKCCWWAPDWGWRQYDGRDGDRWERIYQISTGGWSGNEDIIDAMERSDCWSTWYQTRRGGHYEFRVRLAADDVLTSCQDAADVDIH